MHLYVYVIPVCSVDVPAVNSVVSVLTYCVCNCGACMQSYRILCSYGCSSYRKNILILPDDGHVVTKTCRSHSE